MAHSIHIPLVQPLYESIKIKLLFRHILPAMVSYNTFHLDLFFLKSFMFRIKISHSHQMHPWVLRERELLKVILITILTMVQ